jgi:hypothetical protein
MPRMLGRFRQGRACGNPRCKYCAQDWAKRWRKRVEQREATGEIEQDRRDAKRV